MGLLSLIFLAWKKQLQYRPSGLLILFLGIVIDFGLLVYVIINAIW